MKKVYWLLFLLLPAAYAWTPTRVGDYFEPRSLRVDFALSGNDTIETASLQRLREEPVWGGPRRNLIDTSLYGNYYVRLYDKASGQLIYSRGFCTLFDEWRTTDQAKSETQSWDNSLSVPWPKKNVTLVIEARDRRTMRFRSLLRLEVDPRSATIDRSPLDENPVTRIQYSGDPAGKVDLVFLAEGYTEAEQDKFLSDARRFTGRLFETEPYASHRDDFNIWAVGLRSADSGTDLSGRGVWKNTALNSGFYTFGIDRYLTTPDMRSVRDAVWNVPNDAVFILVNTDIYGGGGFYNFYGLGSADNELTLRVFVHELGHSLAGLADEYFDSEVAYNDYYDLGQEPWEPNITTLVDFGRKWRDMLDSESSVPTAPDPSDPGRLGVYEGGGYVARGIYRPLDFCCMRGGEEFCPVCRRAIDRAIRFLSDR